MITTQTATVYFSPTAKRRFLTLKGASEAEAKARIFGKYPSESYEDDTGAGYNIEYDEPQRYTKMQRTLSKVYTQGLLPSAGHSPDFRPKRLGGNSKAAGKPPLQREAFLVSATAYPLPLVSTACAPAVHVQQPA